MATAITPKQSRLRIKPATYAKLETLAAADKRKPTDQAELMIEQAFEKRARKSASLSQPQTTETAA